MEITVKKALERHKGSVLDTGDGLTEQAHKQETDMNYILRDYKRTGFIRHAKDNQGKYDDISVQDFQEAMFVVAEANNMFAELPANIRKDFNNDPAQFLGFVQNPNNQETLQKMGIITGNDGVDLKGMPTTAPLYKEPVPDAKQAAHVNVATDGGATNITSESV
jgi:phage internal scaffolding protein